MNTSLIVREWINGVWFVATAWVAVIFCRYLWNEVRKSGDYWKPQVQGATACLAYFSGETIYRGWTWIGLKAANEGHIDLKFAQFYWIGIAGATLAILGAICCMRVFSPSSWGHMGWIAILLGSVSMIITAKFASLWLYPS